MRKLGALQGQRRHKFALFLTALVVALAASLVRAQTPAPPGSDGYVDAQVCAGCHAEISKTFRQTGMGRSFVRMTAAAVQADFTQKNRYSHHASKRHYTAYERDGKFYQRRHQIAPDGSETNIVEKEIHYIVGSGNHARSYLHRASDGRLLQLPLTWYAEKSGHWGMSPGYDQPNHVGFRRAVDFECMACHNAYPEIEPGSDVFGRKPVFDSGIPEGIDCQRCHGPGRAHLDALAQDARRDAVIGAIVNPKRLGPERELEVCMQCHLETTSSKLPHSIIRHERGFFSYRPGEPLADFILHFDHAPGTGHDDKFEVVQSVFRLRKSRCFQASVGRMTCTTCHDPHHAPRGEDAAEHYSDTCRNCHETEIAAKVEANEHPSTAQCVSCHMPKRRTEDAVHSVSVDHLIQRHPPERDLLAPLQERPQTPENAYKGEVVAYYPEDLRRQPEGELYLAVAQIKDAADLPRGIPRLEAAIRESDPPSAYFHFELGEAYLKAGRVTNAIRALRSALEKEPHSLPAQKSLGLALLLAKDYAAAAEVTQQALAQEPQDAEIHNTLGEIRYSEKKLDEATRHFRDAIRFEPDLPEAHNNLGAVRLLVGDTAGAEESFSEAVRIKPDFAAAQTNLAQVLRGAAVQDEPETLSIEQLISRAQSAEQANNLTEAARLYERILEQRPDWAAAKLNLGLVYYSQDRFRDAARILAQVVERDPALTSALLFLGASYYRTDRYAEAVPLLERYLSIEPESDEARPFLAASYYARKDYQGAALQYLQQIMRTPNNAELYFHLGEAYSSLAGTLVKSLEDQARDAGATDARYYLLLARVQQALDDSDFALAESNLSELQALDPENDEGRIARGYFHLASGNLTDAKANFEAILSGTPEQCRALQGLANTSMSLDDQVGASEALRKLASIWPGCLTYTVGGSNEGEQSRFSAPGEALAKCRQAVTKRLFRQDAAGKIERTLVMGSCLEINGAASAATATLLPVLTESHRSRYLSFQVLLRLAQRAYKELTRHAPTSPFLTRLRAQERERQGDLAGADAEYQEAVRASGADPRTLLAYAQFKARTGKVDEAAPILEQALQAAPDNPRANAMLGDVLLSLGRVDEAIPHLRRAIEINPGDETSRHKLATALDQSGHLDEAIRVLENAPHDSDGQIHLLLGNLYRRKGERQKAIDALRVYEQRRGGQSTP